MSTCEFFEITHRPTFYKLPNCYIPIQVGFCNTNKRLPYINDESGDSIAHKNSNYCELTAWYWLWKNHELPDYVGLCHYRRFFMKKTLNLFNGGARPLNSEDVKNIMHEYDIILPKPISCGMTVKEFYYNHGEGKLKDIELVEQIIAEKYPECVSATNKIFSMDHSSYWNLSTMKRNDYKEYCDWLFSILFELENRIDISEYTVQEARIYGYLSEILINVWVEYKKLRVYYCDMTFVDENKFKNFLRKIRIRFSK